MNRFTTACILLLLISPISHAADPAPLPKTTPWKLDSLFKAPQMQWAVQQGKVHSLTYRSEPYRGEPTDVFAYYASPRTLGVETKQKKFPGIVLVHGGGGAAFSRWAEIWAGRGYAAIAMDLAGRGEGRKPLEQGGPDQGVKEKFDAIDGSVKDQWSYHAVANVVRAHSLLRSFEEVDAERTAVTGISWGGYLTCIVAGVDQRFKLAMPVYGCGYLHENSVWLESQFKRLKPEQTKRWVTLWDPSQYIGSANMPVVFLNGTNDFAYPMDSYAKTCRRVQGEKNYSIQLRMRHGHLFEFPEFFVAVDQYLKGGTPLPVVARPKVKDGQVQATVTSSTDLVSARLLYTTGPHVQNKTRAWAARPLTISEKTIRGEAPPAEATVWYVELTDARKIVVSSEVMLGEEQ